MPWCQLGDKHQPVAPYVKYLGNELSIFCPFSHCPDAQCTIAHYSNHSSQYDEISRGPCRATIHISSYGDGGVYKCGCANNTANMTQCIHVVDGEITVHHTYIPHVHGPWTKACNMKLLYNVIDSIYVGDFLCLCEVKKNAVINFIHT